MNRVRQIVIHFPCLVELPDGFEQTLDALVGMVTKKYEKENPTRTMWPSGHGSAHNHDFSEIDDTIYWIEVVEREAHERELDRRAHQNEADEEQAAQANKEPASKPDTN